MGKRKIYERNRVYSFFKYYVMFVYRLSYGKREYYGIEKIPKDQAIIYTPNHTSALMDAFAVLDIDVKPKVFVARADIFKNPLFAKVLFFLRGMPINRIRDGRNALKENDEVIKLSAEVLKNNVPFVIAPEGTHRPMHSLLPFGKGVFRIALLANEELQGEKQVYIVPVGLEYGSFFRYRTSLLVQVGDPINVTQFVAENPDMAFPVVMNHLKDMLYEALKELILYIPDDKNYPAVWELCSLSCHKRIKQLGLKTNCMKDRLKANKHTVQKVLEKQQSDPQTSENILQEIARFSTLRNKKGISMASVANPAPGVALFTRIPLLVVLFPYFLICTVLASPTLLITYAICSQMKDKAFHNSVRYVVTLLLWTLTVLVLIPVLFALIPWQLALILLLAGLPAPFIFYQYYKWFRIARSNTKWLLSKELRQDKERFVEWVL
jgi:1-acyl-sn-glycerol-3-phosphate acyltransferase